ncbi:MAG: HdaA/DnaA family protein, partial [Alphaproteobacteria bacterium]
RKRFDDRQIGVEQAVIDYILSRIDRSFSALEAVVQRLDARALAEKRAVTVPLAREVLADFDAQFALDV